MDRRSSCRFRHSKQHLSAVREAAADRSPSAWLTDIRDNDVIMMIYDSWK